MKVLIHACPQRMWYVEGFLVPSLLEQGLGRDAIEIWNDSEGKGNLISCMESFASRTGSGGTWHLQDDVLICSDFVKRCEANDTGIVFGFCSLGNRDKPEQHGRVYVHQAWNGFPCVRIPDSYARECAAWFFEDGRHRPQLRGYAKTGRLDDTFFQVWMREKHGEETVLNMKPNLVEHIDWIIGGSVLSKYRPPLVTSHFWEEPERTEALRVQLLNISKR